MGCYFLALSIELKTALCNSSRLH